MQHQQHMRRAPHLIVESRLISFPDRPSVMRRGCHTPSWLPSARGCRRPNIAGAEGNEHDVIVEEVGWLRMGTIDPHMGESDPPTPTPEKCRWLTPLWRCGTPKSSSTVVQRIHSERTIQQQTIELKSLPCVAINADVKFKKSKIFILKYYNF